MRRLLPMLVVSALLLTGCSAFAQHSGGGFRAGGFHGFARGQGTVTFHGSAARHHRFGGSIYPFFPFYDDFFDSDYVNGSPEVIIIREEAKEAQTPPAPAAVPQAKMIEVPTAASTGSPAADTPVLIVLRDGQKREVTRYTITGAYLYDSSKALETSRIPLDELDLEATVHVNAERGVPFAIPTQKNEVVVRF